MDARRRSTAKPPRKKISEVELCAAFITWAEANSDWVVYCETGGFDMLLIAPDGAQLGIEAKLGCTAKLLDQALPRNCFSGAPGPDFRGVLLPRSPRAKSLDLLESLGLLAFYGTGQDEHFHGSSLTDREGWSHWEPDNRIELPRFLPDVAAGAPSPVRLTKWKIAALKIIALLELRGYVVPRDFRALGVDSRRWTNPASGLLRRDGERRYLRGEKLLFDQQHPRVYAEILAATRRELADQAPTRQHDV
ncbi:MAG TPA: hypothetical protein VHY91_05955 [Pirellulales bacterium]|jgi:hypothetical protein|nr:hypothetical protein [Pirellulales bacterium]